MSLVEAASPRMAELIDLNVGWTEIASGCVFTEGPLWVAAEGAFYFSDMPGDTRRRWTAADGVEVVASPSNKVNGTTLDRDGRQVIGEHSTSSVVPLTLLDGLATTSTPSAAVHLRRVSPGMSLK